MGRTVCPGGTCGAPILEYIYSLSGKKHPKLLYVPATHRNIIEDNGKMRVLRGEQGREVYYFGGKDNKNVIRLSVDCRELYCAE